MCFEMLFNTNNNNNNTLKLKITFDSEEVEAPSNLPKFTQP